MLKISICTVCMNRINHLKQTLQVNLAQNMSYGNFEYVLLDYNSSDGMEQWVQRNMMLYIKKGILKYYRTDEPTYWRMNHARNMAANLATGDIVCLVDADNYAGKNYVNWMNTTFEGSGRKIFVTTSREAHVNQGGQAGKISFYKSDYEAVRAFDETFTDYGMDELDFIQRLSASGAENKTITSEEFMACIEHSNDDRIKNGYLMKQLAAVYLLTSEEMPSLDIIYNQSSHHAFYFLKDNTYLEIVYELTEKQPVNYFTGGWNIIQEKCKKGNYVFFSGGILLQGEGEEPVVYNQKKEGIYTSTRDTLQPTLTHIPSNGDNPLFEVLIIAYSDCHNRRKYEENIKHRNVINPEGWGRGTVYLNFDRTNPINSGS